MNRRILRIPGVGNRRFRECPQMVFARGIWWANARNLGALASWREKTRRPWPNAEENPLPARRGYGSATSARIRVRRNSPRSMVAAPMNIDAPLERNVVPQEAQACAVLSQFSVMVGATSSASAEACLAKRRPNQTVRLNLRESAPSAVESADPPDSRIWRPPISQMCADYFSFLSLSARPSAVERKMGLDQAVRPSASVTSRRIYFSLPRNLWRASFNKTPLGAVNISP